MIADLIAAWRQLRQSPTHAVVVVISLGVGMAVSVAAFSVMNVLAFEERPGIDVRSTLVHIRWSGGGTLLSEQDVDVLDESLGSVFTAVAAEGRRSAAVVLPTGPVTASASFVSPGFFRALGTRPARGRLLNVSDASPDAPPAVAIGERLWRETFQASDDVLGRAITISGRPFTIVGVTPADFAGLIPRDVGQSEDSIPQVWLPLRYRAGARDSTVRAVPVLSVAGRLRPDVTLKRAVAELAVVGSRLTETAAARQRGALWGYRGGMKWSDGPVDVGLVLAVFLFVPLAVLFVGCANVVNLQLARATERSREIGVRLALGASRYRLARLLGLEVVFLAAIAGVVGWRGAIALLNIAAPYLQLPVAVDPEALGFVLCLVIVVIGLSGFTPAWLATRHAVAAGLKETHDGGIQHKRLRAALVVVQIAVSLVFLFVSSLGLRTLQTFIVSLPPGAENTLVARFDLAESHPGLRDSRPFVDAVLKKLDGAAGVTAAGFADFVRSERGVRYWRPSDGPDVRRAAAGGFVTDGWFDAFGVTVVAGRIVNSGDADQGGVVINEGMAASLGTDVGSTLGQRLRIASSGSVPVRSFEVVGVVSDRLTSAGGRAAPAVYLPMPRTAPSAVVLVARASHISSAAAAMKSAVSAADPVVPWSSLETLEAASGDPLGSVRNAAQIGGGLGVCALVIAAIGLHAVLSYAIRRRRHEIGIRMAVGADRRAIASLVLRQALGLVLAGTLTGLAGAVPLGYVMRGAFEGLSPADPVAMLMPVVLLILVGLLAAAIPAYRAASVNPMVVLREP